MAAASEVQGGGASPPLLSRNRPLLGHLLELRRDPLALMGRLRQECGEIGEFNLAGNRIVLFTGAEAQEAFFRAPDEQLDQAAAYPFMKPIFGEGVVFDATPEQRKQAMRNQSLRDKFMRGHAEVIAAEVERMIEGWGDRGELDALDFFSELTLYTSSACLIGRQFRDELGPEYVEIFQNLERGTDAFAYVNPYLPIPALRARDRARKVLVAKIEAVFRRREADTTEYTDLFHVLHNLKREDGTRRYSDDQITGMFISMMFAGHHTTSVTASWCLLELLMNPLWLGKTVSEMDAMYADGREVSYQALREIPLLECALKETLRLHPPLVILMRKVLYDFHYKGWIVPAGHTAAVSPAISNRMSEYFPDAERFAPERYQPGREEDKQTFAWLPFGGGRHRCVGAAFAMMQLKTIFSILLSRYEFELAQPAESYGNDVSKMVVAVRQPCRVRYRRRKAMARTAQPSAALDERAPAGGAFRLRVDLDLCQGHGVCAGEAPMLFAVDRQASKVTLLETTPDPELREQAELAVRHCPTRALSIEE